MIKVLNGQPEGLPNDRSGCIGAVPTGTMEVSWPDERKI